MALTKENIIHEIYKQRDLSKNRSAEAGECLAETIKMTLESGENVLISVLIFIIRGHIQSELFLIQ